MRRGLPLLLLLSLGLAGCANQTANVPLKVRDREYRRVVSLAPGATEVVAAILYKTDALVGRTQACNYPETSISAKPVVATVKPDYEKIKELAPDFIIYDATLYSDADIAKLKETGATLFGLKAKSIDQFSVQMFELANFIGTASQVSDYVDKIHGEAAEAQGDAHDPQRKVAVVMPGANGNHMIAGTDSFVADEVRSACGEPVGPQADKFVPLTPETLVSLNPDVIIVPASSSTDAKSAETILKDPRFKTVTAVKEKRVGAILGDVLLRTGARVDKCIAALSGIINR